MCPAGSRRDFPMSVFWAWTILFVIRAAALFTGIDRLPLVPAAPPEVIINDPAVALSRGFGLTGFSFEHSLNGLNITYANFPPLYIGLQALIFRTLGFSAMTLRSTGAIADLGACAIFLLALRELYKRKILDRFGLAIAGAVLLLEPVTVMHDRSGRMESLCVLFGSLTFLLCLRADRNPARQIPLLCAAGVAAGLAMASHFEALVICAALALWTLPRLRRLRFGWIALNALPLFVVLTVWMIAYGLKSAEAFRHLRGLAVYAPKSSLNAGEILTALAGRDARGVLQWAGPALFLVLLAVLLGGWRLLSSAIRPAEAAGERSGEWRSALLRLTAIVFVQCALIQTIVPGFGSTRIVLAVPFAAVCLGTALSYLGPAQRRVTMVGIALLTLSQLTIITFYLGELRHSWSERGAQRFDNLVEAIPANARVVGAPELWYAFLSHNRRMALIYRADNEEKYWSDEPRAFDPYDVVILDPGAAGYEALHAKAREGRPVEYIFRTYARNFTVDARSLDMTRLRER